MVVVVDPARSHFCHMSENAVENRADPAYGEAPPPCSRSTCCHSGPCPCRYRLWCRLPTVSPSTRRSSSYPVRTNVLYTQAESVSRNRSRSGRSAQRSIPAFGGHNPVNKSIGAPLIQVVISDLDSNPAQIAPRAKNGRHGGVCLVGGIVGSSRASHHDHGVRC